MNASKKIILIFLLYVLLGFGYENDHENGCAGIDDMDCSGVEIYPWDCEKNCVNRSGTDMCGVRVKGCTCGCRPPLP
jgi:hypothetical protein